jgi:glycosyltransferase involved in cell wall biosynthesis
MRFTKNLSNERIWITWEKHRRTTEMAKELSVKVYVLGISSGDFVNRLHRYVILGLKTVWLVLYVRPFIIFAQNPSMVLATILSLVKYFIGYRLIVDRHSNFKFGKNKGIKWRVFHKLSRFTIRNADLTIVTNDFLCKLVNEWGGQGFVLQDKLPELCEATKVPLEGKRKIACVSSFSDDEPTKEVIEAARRLELPGVMIYITGNKEKYAAKYGEIDDLPPNVRLTGFLPESEYQSLLASADAVMVLTKQDHTLNCGAYEAVALGKPMILSNTQAIRNYFSQGAIFCSPTSNEIVDAIEKCIINIEKLTIEVLGLNTQIRTDWQKRFEGLSCILSTWRGSSAGQPSSH